MIQTADKLQPIQDSRSLPRAQYAQVIIGEVFDHQGELDSNAALHEYAGAVAKDVHSFTFNVLQTQFGDEGAVDLMALAQGIPDLPADTTVGGYLCEEIADKVFDEAKERLEQGYQPVLVNMASSPEKKEEVIDTISDLLQTPLYDPTLQKNYIRLVLDKNIEKYSTPSDYAEEAELFTRGIVVRQDFNEVVTAHEHIRKLPNIGIATKLGRWANRWATGILGKNQSQIDLT